MEIGQNTTLYVKALSNGEWFGGWAPVQARMEWLRPDGNAALFTITEEGLDEEDEYEFYAAGTLVIAVFEEGDWRGKNGVIVG
ncbi:MAG: hypothetical protein ACE362_11555 [Phaeodactylibacter xiamenensis]|uniref:Uncharacterized protein n=1 Tax=Phaeodactylibacter xiamenensis TaxID=1524460 RepID=A0A098S4D9_9BACT|nr:hypothetical protein [Phaeodactylibacter xiamenensis]KGE86856.1 hypothetical protein IX84_17465 [Phaeodactylibacter xiamenensis]MCR9052999.1 hypothetical protein [bacterium]